MSTSTPDSSASSINDLPYPVYATQGGGYARFIDHKFRWIEMPGWCPEGSRDIGFIGDEIPQEWDVVAVNEPARRQLELDL